MPGKNFFEDLEDSFRIILSELSATWSKEDIKNVWDEVNFGEYGIALENLLWIAVERNNQLPEKIYDIVVHLAQAMNIAGSSAIHDYDSNFGNSKSMSMGI